MGEVTALGAEIFQGQAVTLGGFRLPLTFRGEEWLL